MADFDPTVDNEPAYDSEIAPHVVEIIRICRARGLPFIAIFQVSSSPLGSVAAVNAHLLPGCDSDLLRALQLFDPSIGHEKPAKKDEPS